MRRCILAGLSVLFTGCASNGTPAALGQRVEIPNRSLVDADGRSEGASISGELMRSSADTVCVREAHDEDVRCVAVRPGTKLSAKMPRDISDPWLVGDSLRAGHHREELGEWAVVGKQGDTLLVAGDPRDPLEVARDSERAPGTIQRQVFRTRPVGRLVAGGLLLGGGLALASYVGNLDPDPDASFGWQDSLLPALATVTALGGVGAILCGLSVRGVG